MANLSEHEEIGREKCLNPTSQARRIQARHRATDGIFQVSRHRETGRMGWISEWLQKLSKKPSGEPPPPPLPSRLTMSWWEHMMI